MKSAAWLIGSVVVICALLGVFMMSHRGGDPVAAQAGEVSDGSPMKNAAAYWQSVPPPESLSLASLPSVPASLSANRLGPVRESYVFSRGDSWRLVGYRTGTMGVVPLSWQVREDEGSTNLVWPVIAEDADVSAVDLKDAIVVTFYESMPRSLEDLYKEDVKLQQDAEAVMNRGARVGPLHNNVSTGTGFFTTSMPGRIMISLYAPVPGKPKEGYECMAATSAARWKTFGKTFETIITHWYDAKGSALYPGFKIEDAIR